MRLIDADKLCEDLLNRWSIADTKKEELIRQVMADVVTPIVISQPTIEPQKWIPFHRRELTEEEQEMCPDWSYWLDCELPEDGEEILISSPTWGVYQDTFNNDGSDGCYLEGDEEIDDGMAWMPLPEPYKEEQHDD